VTSRRAREVFVTTDDGAAAAGYLSAVACVAETARVSCTAASADRRWESVGTALLAGDVTPERVSASHEGRREIWRGATPALLTHLAVRGELCGGSPAEMVVAGYNHGPNVGAMSLHSGTLAAALTARASGVPAIAISVDDYYSRDRDYIEGEPLYWEAADFVLTQALRATLDSAKLFAVSINVPSRPTTQLRGVVLAEVDTRPVHLVLEGGSVVHRRGQDDQASDRNSVDPRVDVEALKADCVTVTPLHTDDVAVTRLITSALSAALSKVA
jgi:5'-nucleotidase